MNYFLENKAVAITLLVAAACLTVALSDTPASITKAQSSTRIPTPVREPEEHQEYEEPAEELVPVAVINITSSSYSPALVHVKNSGSVTWINKDSVAHSLTAEDGSFDTISIKPNESITVAFHESYTKEGAHSYFCKEHPDVRGTIYFER